MTKDYPPKDLSKKELVEMALKLQEESTARKQKLAKMEAEIEEITRASSGKENTGEEKEESTTPENKEPEKINKDEELRSEYYGKALEIITRTGDTTFNNLEKKLSISSKKAKRLLEMLEQDGVIGPSIKGSPREILKKDPNHEENKEEGGYKVGDEIEFTSEGIKKIKTEEREDREETDAEKIIRLRAEAEAELEAKENADKGKEGSRYNFLWQEVRGDSDLVYTYEEGTFTFEINGKESEVTVYEDKTEWKESKIKKILSLGLNKSGKEVFKQEPVWRVYINTENEELDQKYPEEYEFETKEKAMAFAEKIIDEGMKIKNEEEKKFMGIKEPEPTLVTPEKTVSIIEAEKKLDEAREDYINEYNKCKSEADRVNLIKKTKNKILNIFRSAPEDKIKVKVEDFFTEKTLEIKNAYTKAKKEMGEIMFLEKKSELEKAGLSGDELKQALEQYKAVEILRETIINERQKIINAKTIEKPTLFRKLLDGYMSIKPRWKRVALSTIIFLPLAGLGAVGAAAFSYGAVGVVGLATVKFAASMGIGAVVGQSAKGIDWIKKGSDIKFAQNQYKIKTELREKFSKNEIELEDYEKEIEILEKAEKNRNRNRAITKGVVGGVIAFSAGFIAYDAMGNGITHLEGAENHIDTISGADAGNVKPGASFEDNINLNAENGTGAKIDDVVKYESVQATSDNGQGAISTIRELQNNLKLEYKDSLDNAPASVKHILETDPNKLAQEFGMYKPGEDAESLLIKSGSYFKVDSSGNLSFHDIDANNDIVLLKGNEIKVDSPIEGKMFDSDSPKIETEINNTSDENIISATDTEKELASTQVAPETIDANNSSLRVKTTEENIVDSNDSDLYVRPSEINIDILQPTELKELKENYLHSIFPTKKLMRSWENINDNMSAQKLIILSNNEKLDSAYEPLNLYVKKLQELSGLNPYSATELLPPESISDFIDRAYEKINQIGRLDEVKIEDNSNLESGIVDSETNNLTEILESTPSVHEANIDNLKDLKEITKGYVSIPGQPPLKMIIENISGKELKSLVSEEVAETKTAAKMVSDFKMNNIMSSVKGSSYDDYYFNKILPNGNVKLIHIKFYK